MHLTNYNPGKLRFLKVKYDGEEILIKYERLNPNGEWDEYSLKSRQEPHFDFVQALDSLALAQVRMCELLPDGSDYGEEMQRNFLNKCDNPGEVIKQTIRNGWMKLVPPESKSNNHGKRESRADRNVRLSRQVINDLPEGDD